MVGNLALPTSVSSKPAAIPVRPRAHVAATSELSGYNVRGSANAITHEADASLRDSDDDEFLYGPSTKTEPAPQQDASEPPGLSGEHLF